MARVTIKQLDDAIECLQSELQDVEQKFRRAEDLRLIAEDLRRTTQSKLNDEKQRSTQLQKAIDHTLICIEYVLATRFQKVEEIRQAYLPDGVRERLMEESQTEEYRMLLHLTSLLGK